MSAPMSEGDEVEHNGNGHANVHANEPKVQNGKGRGLTQRDLGDDDIEILLDIVRRARDSSNHSTDGAHPTLYTALDEIFTENGWIVENDRDGVLHRFLLLLHREQRSGESLMQRFQRVLGELNIRIDVDEEGEGVDVTTPFRITTRDALREGQYEGRERRGSFESFFDGSADKIAGTTDTAQEVLVRERERRGSDGATTKSNGDLEKWWKKRSKSDTGAVLAQHQSRLPIRAKMNGTGGRLVASKQQPAGRRRAGSASSRGSLRIRRTRQRQLSQPSSYDAESDHTTELDLERVQVPGLNAPIPGAPLTQAQPPTRQIPEPFRPSDTRLLDDAEVFQQQRLHALARRCIQIWRQRTQEQVAKNEELNRLAIACERRNLLKIVFPTWRNEALITQNERETERFFGKLELRADKARNLFLLTKSFTHWAKSTDDEVQRTSVARRHILRTRFFNGWREITVVNELKIQHFVLGRFLDKWRRRATSVRDRQAYAENVCDFNLARKHIRKWRLEYLSRTKPAEYNDRLRLTTLREWRKIATVMRGREDLVMSLHDRELSRRLLGVWRRRTTAVQSLEPQSEDFRRKAALTNALSILQKQAKLAPLLIQFRARVNTARVRSAFQYWRHSSQLSRQAKSVDRLRLLRNTWTMWNDQLRIKALEERINDRVLVEAMYRWTLAARVTLFQRVHDRNNLRSVFLTWFTRTNEQRNTLDSAERRFADFKCTQLLRIHLRKFEIATAERKIEEAAIKAQYDQKLKQRIFDVLRERSQHFQELRKWAADARFYLLAKQTLKNWGEATQHARRNRRREMYAQMRRMVKMNLARRMLGTWIQKAGTIAENEQQANGIVRAGTMQYAAVLLRNVHDRTTALRNREAQVQQQYNDRLKNRCLAKLTEHRTTLQRMDSQAVALRQENIDIAALSALKKLGWRLWTVRRQEETAIALHQRNFEKHQRLLLRDWLEQALERRAGRAVSPTPTRRSREGRRDRDDEQDEGNGEYQSGRRGRHEDDNEFGDREDEEDTDADKASPFGTVGEETQRLEAWTAFDQGALGLSNLDLSFSLSPERNPAQLPHQPPLSIRPSASTSRFPLPTSSSRHPPPNRPQTVPQPTRSALRPRPQVFPLPPPPIPEDLGFDDPSAFWTSTPMPSTSAQPRYLKTPSKRSVARSKRPELPASPENRVLGLERGLGVMSAPPVQGRRDFAGGGGVRGVKSFGRRLEEGGFVRGGRDWGEGSGRGDGTGGKGKGRVEFGDVSHFA